MTHLAKSRSLRHNPSKYLGRISSSGPGLVRQFCIHLVFMRSLRHITVNPIQIGKCIYIAVTIYAVYNAGQLYHQSTVIC